ncbi:hypothetical protein NQ315_013602 [Exocentrus adspersus]|uniref:Leucine-rich repeat-containing protein 51 n=1 Tax=Exocentrus adspersus TaxID=1586481 RepID=A0AAV8W499_9CUCU|nr:hypothetical protein NQ315_013602 [Exocentrus adspersus]
MNKEETALLSIGKPADFSFRKLKSINVDKFLRDIGLEGARYTRVAGVPERGAEKKKFLTRSLWLNNNKLTNTKHVDQMADSVLEYPDELGWIDFSFNYITEIDECILRFNKLKILYFHGNCISDLDEVFKLRNLPELRSVTFHGNPIANHPRYRSYVVSVLPQIANLDFTPVVRNERLQPAPPEVVKKLKEIDKAKY